MEAFLFCFSSKASYKNTLKDKKMWLYAFSIKVAIFQYYLFVFGTFKKGVSNEMIAYGYEWGFLALIFVH